MPDQKTDSNLYFYNLDKRDHIFHLLMNSEFHEFDLEILQILEKFQGKLGQPQWCNVDIEHENILYYNSFLKRIKIMYNSHKLNFILPKLTHNTVDILTE